MDAQTTPKPGDPSYITVVNGRPVSIYYRCVLRVSSEFKTEGERQGVNELETMREKYIE